VKLRIIFHTGAYGTYLHWLVHTMLSTTVDDPLIESGASHGFNNNHPVSTAQTAQGTIEIERLHLYPEPTSGDMAQTLHNHLAAHGPAVFCYPRPCNYLLTINNHVYKSPHRLGEQHPSPEAFYQKLFEFNRDNIRQGWNLEPDQMLLPQHRWILREFMSLNFFSNWQHQTGWYLPDQYTHPDCLYVYVEDLLQSPGAVLDQIRDFYGLVWQQPYSSVQHIHDRNLQLQQYRHQDSLAKDIMSAVEQQRTLQWQAEDITLVTEAYLQKSLRDLGLDLRCQDLNHFPTDASTLRGLAT
jgi:hypothetical protein